MTKLMRGLYVIVMATALAVFAVGGLDLILFEFGIIMQGTTCYAVTGIIMEVIMIKMVDWIVKRLGA